MSEQQPKKRTRIKKNQNKDSFYVQPEFLMNEIRKYYETDRMSNDLGNAIMEQVNRLQSKYNFKSYTYIEEMRGDAITKIIEVLNKKNFDLNLQTNPFSYFTTIQWNCFIAYIRKEKQKDSTVKNLIEMKYDELMHEPGFDEMYHLYFKNNSDHDNFVDVNMLDSDEMGQ